MATAPGFPSFPRLPPEVRRIIWRLAMPDDQPEICIIHQLPAEIDLDLTPVHLYVGTGPRAYPAIMGVCTESLAFVFESHGYIGTGAVVDGAERYYPRALVRSFQPGLDVLVLRARHWYPDGIPRLDQVVRHIYGHGLRGVRTLAVAVEGFDAQRHLLARLLRALAELGFANTLHVVDMSLFPWEDLRIGTRYRLEDAWAAVPATPEMELFLWRAARDIAVMREQAWKEAHGPRSEAPATAPGETELKRLVLKN